MEKIDKADFKILSDADKISSTCSDPNVLYDIFVDIVLNIYNQCFPYKKVCIKSNKNEWFDENLRKMYRKKNILYRKFVNNPTEYRKNVYVTYKNKYTNAVKNTKKTFYTQKFLNVKGNSTGTSKLINNILAKKKATVSEDVEFKDDSGMIYSQEEIAEKFNQYFVDIGKKLSLSFANTDLSVHSYLKGSYIRSLFLKPVTEKEIIDVVLSFKNGKSPGYDFIDIKLFKEQFIFYVNL